MKTMFGGKYGGNDIGGSSLIRVGIEAGLAGDLSEVESVIERARARSRRGPPPTTRPSACEGFPRRRHRDPLIESGCYVPLMCADLALVGWGEGPPWRPPARYVWTVS